jgi:phage replication O-like protein O
MASPQTEDGYTKIANEIQDALCHTRIPGEERQVLDVIFRKTYGWNKCEDAISLSQFSAMTGIKKPNVIGAIKGLLSKKIIIVIQKDNSPAHVYKFNKNYEQWKPLSKKITTKIVIQKDNPSLSKKIPTKDTTTKDNIYPPDFLKFWEAYPNKKAKLEAFKAWSKSNGQRPHVDTLLTSISKQKQSLAWKKDNGQFIPHPATWLRQGRWEDEGMVEKKSDPFKN